MREKGGRPLVRWEIENLKEKLGEWKVMGNWGGLLILCLRVWSCILYSVECDDRQRYRNKDSNRKGRRSEKFTHH